MYSREVRLPADLVYSTVETDRPDSGNDFITTKRETLREAFQATRETLGQAARHRKRWYDMRSRPQTFATGDSVWCLVPKNVSGRYQKWRSQYECPFKIISQLGPVTYTVQEINGRRTWTIHVDKLKHCFANDKPETEEGTNTPPLNHTTESPRPRRTTRLPLRFR